MESLLERATKGWLISGSAPSESSPARVLEPQSLELTLTNVQQPSRKLPLEVSLEVAEKELDSVLSGELVPQMLSDLGLKPEVGERFLSQVSKQAKADGLDLTKEESRLLANLMFLVGKKLAEEI